LDINLPGLDGIEALQRLKAMPALADIPVIMVSADATSDTQARAQRAGCQGFLVKPFMLEELLDVLNREI